LNCVGRLCGHEEGLGGWADIARSLRSGVDENLLRGSKIGSRMVLAVGRGPAFGAQPVPLVGGKGIVHQARVLPVRCRGIDGAADNVELRGGIVSRGGGHDALGTGQRDVHVQGLPLGTLVQLERLEARGRVDIEGVLVDDGAVVLERVLGRWRAHGGVCERRRRVSGGQRAG